MRIRSQIFPLALAFAAVAAPTLADSVAVGTSSNGTVIVNGKPCRVVTTKDGSNSTTITSGAGGLSGSTTVSPGGGSSVTILAGGPPGSCDIDLVRLVSSPRRSWVTVCDLLHTPPG